MLWTWPTSQYGSLWSEMDQLQREISRLFEPLTGERGDPGNFPAVNIWTGQDNALLTADIPGVDPDKLEVTIKDNTVTIRGSREPEEIKEGESYLRRERGAGTFVRSFALPFQLDEKNASAQYRMGILQLMLPRAEEDKPKKISIKAG